MLHNQVFGGLVVSGEENRLIRNIVVDSELTGRGILIDTHGDCTHNRWIANTAAQADPPCILEGPLTVSEAR